MAYSKAPAQDTYQTKQIPLVYEWDNRLSSTFSGGADPKQTVAQNVYFELVENRGTGEAYYHVIKRDGVDEGTVTATKVIGMYFWETAGVVVIVTPTQIIRHDPTTGVDTPTATADFGLAADAVYGVNFTEFLFEDGHSELIIASDTVFGTFTVGGTWTACSDPDRPLQIRSYPVFLDGYLFLVSVDGSIYNSDLNNPMSWTASNFIAVESYPDFTQAIARVGSYIVALGSTSTEWFYDAANPTGTPLARVEGATQEVGYIQGLVGSDNAIYFVGRSNRGSPSVYKIMGLKLSEVSSPTVRRWLNTTTAVPNSRGHIITMGGHRFYVVVQNRNEVDPTQTYMLDLDNQMWSSLVLRGDSEGPFIFTSTTVLQNNITDRYSQVLTYFSEYDSTRVWTFRAGYNQDLTAAGTFANYTCKFITRPLDFSNYRMKFVGRLLFGTDQTATTSLMSASWSDDDLQTFSTPRTFDVSRVYTPLWACGTFRKRSFKLEYADNFPMRWRSVEIDYNQGQA